MARPELLTHVSRNIIHPDFKVSLERFCCDAFRREDAIPPYTPLRIPRWALSIPTYDVVTMYFSTPPCQR